MKQEIRIKLPYPITKSNTSITAVYTPKLRTTSIEVKKKRDKND
jgi:hypothetical protein